MKSEADQWFRLARTDLATAEQLSKDRIFYAAVFFAQQAAEKALKSLWIVKRQELAPRTHNLVGLARELSADETILDAAAELAPEFILSRYITPDIASPEELYDAESARVHIEAARRVLEWVERGGGES